MKLKKLVDGKEYVLEQNFWTGKVTLLVDGEEMTKSEKKPLLLVKSITKLRVEF